MASHEFNTKSLRNFIETVVDAELHDRLGLILMSAVVQDLVLDSQDVLQRFAFDNICQIAFGHLIFLKLLLQMLLSTLLF